MSKRYHIVRIVIRGVEFKCAEINHVVSGITKFSDQFLFERKAPVIGRHANTHLVSPMSLFSIAHDVDDSDMSQA